MGFKRLERGFLHQAQQGPPAHRAHDGHPQGQQERKAHFQAFLLGVHAVFLALAHQNVQVVEAEFGALVNKNLEILFVPVRNWIAVYFGAMLSESLHFNFLGRLLKVGACFLQIVCE